MGAYAPRSTRILAEADVGDYGFVGRLMVLAGGIMIVLGALLAWGPPLQWLGRLPGDVTWRGSGWTIHLPITTSLLVSAVLSLLFALVRRR
jgi:hypothetical protein